MAKITENIIWCHVSVITAAPLITFQKVWRWFRPGFVIHNFQRWRGALPALSVAPFPALSAESSSL